MASDSKMSKKANQDFLKHIDVFFEVSFGKWHHRVGDELPGSVKSSKASSFRTNYRGRGKNRGASSSKAKGSLRGCPFSESDYRLVLKKQKYAAAAVATYRLSQSGLQTLDGKVGDNAQIKTKDGVIYRLE